MAVSKAHIVEEIKRLAKSSGVAPGYQAFETATGIKVSDWKGRYWARWGDALAEAGYAPNAFGAEIPIETLLTKLRSFVEEIGRFPATDDMRIKRRSDPDFPSYEAFTRRWPKSELPRALFDYCGSDPTAELVRTLCLSDIERQSLPAEEQAVEEPEFGWVYLVKSGRYYKIGRSNSSGRRLYEIALQMPEPAQLVHEIKTDDPVGIEAYWHARFAEFRMNGEWFALGPSEIAAFCRRKNFM